ncbi:MAG: CysB family HTH-type transcriptional regulator [Gammaproteobacteria bacterium]
MKLLQLRYLVEIAKHQSISKAAAALCTSQSGISKQIILLEQELRITLFVRKGRNLSGLTPAGKRVLEQAKQIMARVKAIKQITEQLNNESATLTIATTHTQARYVLPFAVDRFMQKYPTTVLHIHQGTPVQVAKMLEEGEVDLAIATESLADNTELVALPCYQWNRSIIVKQEHSLAQQNPLTLEQIVHFPIITYDSGFTGRHRVDEAFAKEGLSPNIVLTAVDSDVIKTYVRLGLGVGIIASMAFSPEQDKDLLALDGGHLFGRSTSQIAIKKDAYLPQTIYRFIELIAPHLTELVIKQAAECHDLKTRKQMLSNLPIPMF